MRAWVDVLEGRAVVGAGGEPIGNVQSVEVDTGTWRVLGLRVVIDGAVAAELGIRRPLFSRPTIDVPTERLVDTGASVKLAGGHAALAELASAQGQLVVEQARKRIPRPATPNNPEPAEDAAGGKPAGE